MIQLSGVKKTYKNSGVSCCALNNINLTIETGEFIGIIGKSGAGKSTLLRCFNLLEQPDSGEVWVNQQNLLTLSASQLRHARKKIGMVFQHFNLLSAKTVFENIALPLHLENKSLPDITRTVNALIKTVGLQHKAEHYPSQLSGGQKQRVAIARALVNQPNVLLCDEITSALDPESSQSILQLLQEIQRKQKLTVVLITHDMRVIKQCADRVILIDKGKLIEDQPVNRFFSQPKTELAQELTQACLRCELPTTLRQQIQHKESEAAVLRIKFLGQPAVEPIIDTLIRSHDLKVNLFQANLETIQQETLGMMILSATGTKTDLQSALLFLHTQSCETQILGYL
jgi:D-methionine transport system ATP-binding protein